MDVLLIGMRGNDKSVPPLRPAHSRYGSPPSESSPPRIEGLSYLIAQHIICLFLFPTRYGGIADLCHEKLVRHGDGIALISGDILSAFCFLRVLAIVQTILIVSAIVLPSPAWRCNKVVVARNHPSLP